MEKKGGKKPEKNNPRHELREKFSFISPRLREKPGSKNGELRARHHGNNK